MEKPIPWPKKGIRITLFFAGFLALSLLLAFLFLAAYVARNPDAFESPDLSNAGPDLNASAENESSYWFGAAAPAVTIVQFADFSCSHCKAAFPTIREISHAYRDKVKFVFRDFPALSENSLVLALAGRCAGEQGLFWLMHDKMYLHEGGTDAAALTALAASIGADPEKFSDCLTGRKYLSEVQADFAAGQKLGVSGTPTFFINGRMIEGDIPYPTFIRIMDSLLKTEP